jgi:hypothetical protein
VPSSFLCATVYDGGNHLDVTAGTGNASNRLLYSDTCGQVQSAGVGDIMYSTCHTGNYFTATFTSASGNITGFSVGGEVGSGDTVEGGPLNRSGTSNYFGFYKATHDGNVDDDDDGGDPTVNHLVVVPSSNWSQNFSADADDDEDIFRGPGVSTLTYVLFAGRPLLQLDELHNESDFTILMEKVVSFLESGSVCQVLRGKVCVCDATQGACTDDVTRYSVAGPEFGPITRAGFSSSAAPTPAPGSPGSSNSSSGGVSTGAVAGIVIAVILLLVVAVVVVVVVVKKREDDRPLVVNMPRPAMDNPSYGKDDSGPTDNPLYSSADEP